MSERSDITDGEILEFFKKFYKAKGCYPTQIECTNNGFTKGLLCHRFGSLVVIKELCDLDLSTEYLEAPKEQVKKKLKLRQRKYVIIGIQNNTYLNQDFMDCLHNYAEYNKAEILALPMYYQNPNSVIQEGRLDKEYWWDTNFNGSFVVKNMRLGRYLKLMPEHRITVTSLNPLVSLESVGGNYSAIYSNPQFAMNIVPELPDKMPHILHTTGTACKLNNFSKSNIGGKAKNLATTGALIIELDGDIFHLRQLEFVKNCIYDLDKKYTKSKVETLTKLKEETALVWGDLHSEVIDKKVLKQTLDLSKDVNTKKHILHDIIDFSCQSHHNKYNLLRRYFLNKYNKDSVIGALKSVCDILTEIQTKTNSELIIVDSNHHDHLMKWLNEKDFKTMGHENAYFYVCLVKYLFEHIKFDVESLSMTNCIVLKAALEVYADLKLSKNSLDFKKCKFLDRIKSTRVNNIEISQHGDLGSGGARGSLMGFSKPNHKIIIGHSHTPGIRRKVYQVGKTAVNGQDYLKGYTSHLHTHCLIYPNGARALINFIEGNYKI